MEARQQRSHKLLESWDAQDLESWDAQDYAKQARQAASAAAKFHHLISQRANELNADLIRLEQKQAASDREIARLNSEIAGARTTCMAWGVGGAIVASMVMSLILAPALPTSSQSFQSSQSQQQ